MAEPERIVLAYSGGLDTSVILAWLKETYACPVIAYCADVGQGGELVSARQRAEEIGAEAVVVEDLRTEFVRDYVFPLFRANAVYEGSYLLGTSIARPLIAARQVAIARARGADALAHGATGKGNDQVRFELAYLALAPNLQVIAPWRLWDLNARSKLLAYARRNGIATVASTEVQTPYSTDANLLHISYEGGELEDPDVTPAAAMWQRTVDPLAAPTEGQEIKLSFQAGDPVAVDGEELAPAALLSRLNSIAGAHGIGRLDIVENRYVGMKSRGCYETPGGTLLLAARRALETITLDREVMRLREDLMPRYAEMVYNGYWFSPERKLLQTLFDESQQPVCGCVRLRLYKGAISILGRSSELSLYEANLSTFEDDQGAFDQRDAGGFIRLNALRLHLNRIRDERGSSS